MITIESRIREDSLGLERLIFGIEIAILNVLVQLAMELVSAALHDRVELAARGVAVLGLELVLQQRELSDGFTGHKCVWSGDVFSVIVNAFNREVVVSRTLPPDRRTRANT